MQTRNPIFILFTLTLVIILAACSPQVNNRPEDQPDPTVTELPAFEWRNPNPSMVEVGEPYFDKAISLVEPALCLDDLTLEDVLRNADESMTLLFRNGSGEIPDGEYVALIDGVEQFYACEINGEEADLLACTGPDIPAGTEISVRFGDISGRAFENLDGTNPNINLVELWNTKQTNLVDKFDFQLVEELAGLYGYAAPGRVKLEDAYGLIAAAASLNVNEALVGGGWGEPSWLLLSSLPQFQKTGLACDSYWECAKACAKEINYDLRSDDLIGAFDFYKNFASKLGKLLPDTCQAFNGYAKTLTPRPSTPQYLDYQWRVVSSDRLTLYDPSDQLFDLYDSNYHYQPVSIPTAIDVIPDDINQCAADNGWPYGEITDLETFLNWYFNTLFGYQGENQNSSQNNFGGIYTVYPNTYYCTSDEARAWIELATNEISGSPEDNDEPYFESQLIDCANFTSYELRMWPDEFGEEDIPGFLAWLFDLWSQSPESIPNSCTAYLASDEFQADLGILNTQLNLGESVCTLDQEGAIQSLRYQFGNRYDSCGIDEADACSEFDPTCQEDAFIASLLEAGRIGGPETCYIDGPAGFCLGEYSENTFVPPDVWECALDTCGAAQYPLQRGEGVYGFAQFLNAEYQDNFPQLPSSCKTAEVIQWMYQNRNCASEVYSEDEYDYSSCGLPYPDLPSGTCYMIPFDGGYYLYCSEFENDPCPSCSTVYQCAEGEESIFCDESPAGEDPGYWGQLDLCAEQIEWDGGVQTYKDASDLVQYLITAAPFLQVDDIPAACKVSVDQTLIPGLPYGEFLTKLTLGGKVEGSTVCSEAKQFTIPEEPTVDRCAEFNPSQYRLTILDIPANSNLVSMYLTMPGGVPGLEREVPDDTRPWEYTGILGDVEAENCGFYDYSNRLYCSFVVPPNYIDSVRPLQLSVNGCEVPFYSFSSVSLIQQEESSCSPPVGGCPTGSVSSGGLTQGYFDTSSCSCKLCDFGKVWNGSACIRP